MYPLSNAVTSELNPSGTGIVYSNYLGGSGYPLSVPRGVTTRTVYYCDLGFGLAVASSGAVYMTGEAASPDFLIPRYYQPTKNGEYCGFIAKLNLGSSSKTTRAASANPEASRG